MLTAATISLIYGSGSQRSMKILLQKDASQNRVAVQSEQFSQEVDLGQTASYDLNLELYSRTSNSFMLEVLNLPSQVGRTFKDPQTGARLNQVRFTESSRSKRTVLQLDLPDRTGRQIALDEPIRFYAVVAPADKLKLDQAGDSVWTEQQLDSLDVGYVMLELVVRGSGELVIRSNQLYASIAPDERRGSAWTWLMRVATGWIKSSSPLICR